MNARRIGKWVVLIVLGAAAAVAQGLAVFWYMEPHGLFLGRAGLQCTAIPLLVEVVLLVVTMKNLDQLHASAISNPHSLFGQSLRDDTGKPAASPPPTRSAWDGQFEDPAKAADKMASGR